jgi:hypothetical protein
MPPRIAGVIARACGALGLVTGSPARTKRLVRGAAANWTKARRMLHTKRARSTLSPECLHALTASFFDAWRRSQDILHPR